VVAVWEQPGAGKSYPAINFRTVKVDDYINDGLELTRYLRELFHQDKIYLVGHSWGTMLTVWMAERHPEYYRAVVNAGQMTNITENDRFGYYLSLDGARKANDTKVVAQLEKNGLYRMAKAGHSNTWAIWTTPMARTP
jgi:pimeloyl-ACP methyl ester carboxylesterase